MPTLGFARPAERRAAGDGQIVGVARVRRRVHLGQQRARCRRARRSGRARPGCRRCSRRCRRAPRCFAKFSFSMNTKKTWSKLGNAGCRYGQPRGRHRCRRAEREVVGVPVGGVARRPQELQRDVDRPGTRRDRPGRRPGHQTGDAGRSVLVTGGDRDVAHRSAGVDERRGHADPVVLAGEAAEPAGQVERHAAGVDLVARPADSDTRCIMVASPVAPPAKNARPLPAGPGMRRGREADRAVADAVGRAGWDGPARARSSRRSRRWCTGRFRRPG